MLVCVHTSSYVRSFASLWVRPFVSSFAAAGTRLQPVLIAGSALEGFEGVCEAVAEHRHFAAMAHWARDEGEASTGLARVVVLGPLESKQTQKSGHSRVLQREMSLHLDDLLSNKCCMNLIFFV